MTLCTCLSVTSQESISQSLIWDSVLIERQTHDQMVASSNPSRSSRNMFFCRVNFVCWPLFSGHLTPVLPQWLVKDPSLFCQKLRWQITPKHANTLDPMKLEWVDYASVQHSLGTYLETSSHAAHQGTLGHSRLSSLSHFGLIPD